ncbi:MAG TPA: DUF962 domain-containing protein [Acidobacteriota bacterium]
MPLKSLVDEYRRSHRHPINNALHFIGIPLIVISLLLVFWSWKLALTLFIAGWALQFAGHAVEGNHPAFFRNPLFLIIGPLSFLQKLVQKITRKHAPSK